MIKSWWVASVAVATLVLSGAALAIDASDARFDPAMQEIMDGIKAQAEAKRKAAVDAGFIKLYQTIGEFQAATATVDAKGHVKFIQVIVPPDSVVCNEKICRSINNEVRKVLKAVSEELATCKQYAANAGSRMVKEEWFMVQRANLETIVFEDNASPFNILAKPIRFHDATSEIPGKILKVALNRGLTDNSYDIEGTVAKAFSDIPVKFDYTAAWNSSRHSGP